MTYRVVQWSTGNVGVHAIAGIDANPALELVGCFVSNPAKEGVDVGRLANLGRDLGVTATTDSDALIALKPDCIVHTAWADSRLGAAPIVIAASAPPDQVAALQAKLGRDAAGRDHQPGSR